MSFAVAHGFGPRNENAAREIAQTSLSVNRREYISLRIQVVQHQDELNNHLKTQDWMIG